MSQPIRIRSPRTQQLRAGAPCAGALCAPALLGCVSLAALLGCSGDVVNLGEDASPRPTPPPYSRCIDSPKLTGDVVVSEQAQLAELEGCETIEGDLYVQPFFLADLRPLHDLKAVEGTLGFTLAPKPDGSGATNEESERMQAVFPEWLTSFDGMESLERVGSLNIFYANAPDLSSFSQLRALTGEGRLELWNLNIRDLDPLVHLQGIKALSIESDQIESIAALQLPPTLSALWLGGEQLTELGAVRSLRRVDTDLSVTGTLLHDLTAFSRLESVGGDFRVSSASVLESLHGLENLTSVGGGVELLSNPLLQNLDGLTSLKSADGLAIAENLQLRRVPDFPALGAYFKSLAINDNPALEQIAGFSGILASWTVALPDGTSHRVPFTDLANRVYLRPDSVLIRNNPALRSFSMPAGWPGGKFVEISSNASLETLDLLELEAVDILQIRDNPALRNVDLGALDTVDVLSVVGNPQLSPSTFDSVRTFESTLAGNSGQPPATQEDYL